MQPHANTFLPAVRLNGGECKATHVWFWRAARPHLCVYIYIYISANLHAANKCNFKLCKTLAFLDTGYIPDKFCFLDKICYTKNQRKLVSPVRT